MDSSNSGAWPTGQVPSEPALTAYHQGTPSDAALQSSFASSPLTWTSDTARLGSRSRDNLRQASVALDTAYERITSLRNSINNMLNRIPPEVAGTASSTSTSTDTSDTQPRRSLSHDADIRPPHTALVLSGEQVVEELNLRAARLRSLISPTARQRLEEFESSNRNNARSEPPAWDGLSQSDRPRLDRSDVHPVPPRLRTPPMPDIVLPRATERRDLQNTNRDESSTVIGRRVAARVSAPDRQRSLSSRLSLSQIEQRLQAQTAQVARELENMTERLAAHNRRVELASARGHGDNTPAAAGQDNGTSTSGDPRPVPTPPVGRRPLRPARDVTVIDTTRIILPQSISRTSSDGTPIDELSSRARRSLSAAFREHIASYRDHVQVAQDTPRNLANAPDVRGALVDLLTRERDDARQAEYARPDAETGRREDASVRSNPSSPAGQGRRRRGWTRLNADGDEIDSDEDDDVSPHTRRLRMRFAYGMSNVDQPGTRSHTVTIEDILWRTSGSDSEADAVSPDATESGQSLFQNSPPRSSFRRPHPLPTPVEDMMVYPIPEPPQPPRVICVSKHASFAGR